MSTYVVTRRRRMVHRTTCIYAKSKSARPWAWADGMTPMEILRQCLRNGWNVHQCSRCMAITQIEPGRPEAESALKKVRPQKSVLRFE